MSRARGCIVFAGCILSKTKNHDTRRVLRRATLVVVASALLGLVGCSALPTRSITSDHDIATRVERHRADPPSTTSFATVFATPADREATLAHVWQTIRSSYFDETFGGVDIAAVEAAAREDLLRVHNDAEFYEVLERSVATLHDSHTLVVTAADAEVNRTQEALLIGITYSVVDDCVVIIDVAAGSPASDAGIMKGMLLTNIDGIAIDAAFLARAATIASPDESDAVGITEDARRRGRQLSTVAALLSSEHAPAPVRAVTLRRADDTFLSVTVQARPVDLPSTMTYAVLPSKVAVLRFNRFDFSLQQRIVDAIDSAQRDDDDLVIDLRDNGGGAFDVYLRLMDHLFDRPTFIGQIRHRYWFGNWTTTLETDPVEHPYTGRIAVLVDGETASSAELMAQALVELRGATLVGEQTCGCVVGNRDEFVLPDGGVLRVAQADLRSARGRRLEGDPLVPSISTTPTLAQLRANEDVALNAAVAALGR